jgi:hypothetical protein
MIAGGRRPVGSRGCVLVALGWGEGWHASNWACRPRVGQRKLAPLRGGCIAGPIPPRRDRSDVHDAFASFPTPLAASRGCGEVTSARARVGAGDDGVCV